MLYSGTESETSKNWNDYLDKYRSERNFNVEKWTKKKINVFNEYLGKHNLSGAVLAVSGGVDSALTLALLKKTKEFWHGRGPMGKKGCFL